ncbi:potassium channel protein [candidate division KSB3 bacterium]|uniref:Potassium channel protein n=1 Tax=candidate division KSB3 bacterium TaxID=2044937 RepID=A0A9D5JRX7_9BACT|nr:potassium channel protein [candidate division KSB3 bacterium]MBD3323063.1 potassium channel protein [candidate division KSB3 bacterium]
MTPRVPHSRPLYAIAITTLVIGIGTLGYSLLEGWSLVDAFYMTIITMTTVGYGEIQPLSEAGRLFTIGLIITSIGIVGYVFSALTAFIVEGQVRQILRGRKMDKQIAKLKDHIILCGMGRTGLHIAEEFTRTQTPFVAIEQDPAALEEADQFSHLLYLQGDATQDETLLAAGIKQARGLVTTLSEDKDNVFVVLCARSLNPELRVIARLVEEKNEELLRKAGADQIVSPDAIGGMRMASVMLRPTVVSFLDEMLRVTGQSLLMEEMRVDDFPGLLDRSLGAVNIRKRTGAMVVAIKSQAKGYQFNPGAEAMLHRGDILIVLGTHDQLDPKLWASECRT